MTEAEIEKLRAYIDGVRPIGADKSVGDTILRILGRNAPESEEGLVARAAHMALLIWGPRK